MKLSTAGRSGVLNKTVKVDVDDPETPRLTFKIKANVVVKLGFEQTSIRFRDVDMGAKTPKTMNLLANLDRPVKLGELTTTLDGLTVKLVDPPKGAADDVMKVLQLDYEPAQPGIIRGTVKLVTDHPELSSLLLHVSGNVHGEIAARPSRLTINMASERAQHVTVTSRKAPFRILGATSTDGYIETKLHDIAAGKTWKVDVAPSDLARAQTKGFSSTLTITTDSQAVPSLDVPIYFYVPAPAAER